jgi:hypothetical protein
MKEADSRMMVGVSSVEPRMALVPVRLPTPRYVGDGESIFEKQSDVRFTPFERATPRRPGRAVVAELNKAEAAAKAKETAKVGA